VSPEGTIAHYRVLGKIGEGGMGAVYRATDTKLNREVAIKVLPDELSNDAEYVARFQREAQMLGSLNHPNIAILHGIEQNALIMELVPGVTLTEKLKAGRMPLAEVAAIGIQIAAALEAAHEKGLVHRDLKPSNVKVTPDGVVKVLDFGIAKTVEQPVTASSTDSTTRTIPTHAGMILGTAAYMSPEQASARRVDRRADIWSFGVVLYEMVSGDRLFEGESLAHTLAHVLTREIKLDTVDASFRPLIRRCLQRDPRKRLRDIGDALLALEEYLADPTPAARPARPILPWAVAALLAAAGAVGWWKASRPGLPQGWVRLSMDLGPDAVRDPAITVVISRDGRRVVYPVQGGRRDAPRDSHDGSTEGRCAHWNRRRIAAFLFPRRRMGRILCRSEVEEDPGARRRGRNTMRSRCRSARRRVGRRRQYHR
jgi:serine/threonine-protein kinase